MTLGERIKECRQNARLSQEKVAELVGVSRQAVTKWESNQSAPNTENLFKLAEIFGTTVDLLVASEDSAKQSPAEQIYYLYKLEEEKKRSARKKRIRENMLWGIAVVFSYLLVYLIGRLISSDMSTTNFAGLLFGSDSKYYLFGWLLSSRLYWAAMTVSALPAFFGKRCFPVITFVHAAAGILLGEVFGVNPAGAAYGQGHYGWAIWICLFLSSVVFGIIFEKRFQSGFSLRSQKTAVWLAAMVAAAAVIVCLFLVQTQNFNFSP